MNFFNLALRAETQVIRGFLYLYSWVQVLEENLVLVGLHGALACNHLARRCDGLGLLEDQRGNQWGRFFICLLPSKQEDMI